MFAGRGKTYALMLLMEAVLFFAGALFLDYMKTGNTYSLLGSLILGAVLIGSVYYVFRYLRIDRWRPYYLVAETVRDTYGNENMELNLFRKGSLEKPLYEYDGALLRLDERHRQLVKDFEEVFRMKIRWVRLWVKQYIGQYPVYEGWIIYGTPVSIFEHCNFTTEEIFLEGLPAVVELGAFETLELERITEYIPIEKPYSLKEKILGIRRHEEFEEEEVVDEAFKPMTETKRYVKRPIPVRLIVYSPYMATIYGSVGFGILQQFEDSQEAVKALTELRKCIKDDIINTYEERLKVYRKHLDAQKRIMDEGFDFGVYVERHTVGEVSEAPPRKIPWNKIIFYLSLFGFVILLTMMLTMKFM